MTEQQHAVTPSAASSAPFAAKPALFPPGQIVATRGAIMALAAIGQTPNEYLARHLLGDWGDLDAEDAAMNNAALKSGDDRLFSAYRIFPDRDEPKVWVITEWDRSVTTVLLPEEY